VANSRERLKGAKRKTEIASNNRSSRRGRVSAYVARCDCSPTGDRWRRNCSEGQRSKLCNSSNLCAEQAGGNQTVLHGRHGVCLNCWFVPSGATWLATPIWEPKNLPSRTPSAASRAAAPGREPTDKLGNMLEPANLKMSKCVPTNNIREHSDSDVTQKRASQLRPKVPG